MTAPQSIAELIRQEIAITSSNSMQLSRTLGLNQPSLWRFIHGTTDPRLATAETLLHHFGYVVIRERDAKAAGIPYFRPSADTPTARKAQRARNAAKRTKATKTKKPLERSSRSRTARPPRREV